MHYPKVLERVDFPEQIFHRSFSLGAPVFPAKCHELATLWKLWRQNGKQFTDTREMFSAVARDQI